MCVCVYSRKGNSRENEFVDTERERLHFRKYSMSESKDHLGMVSIVDWEEDIFQ